MIKQLYEVEFETPTIGPLVLTIPVLQRLLSKGYWGKNRTWNNRAEGKGPDVGGTFTLLRHNSSLNGERRP